MRRYAFTRLLLCLCLLPAFLLPSPAARAADDPRLVFSETLLVLFSGEKIDLPVPKARADGKTKALTARQKDGLRWKWTKEGAALASAPTEPGLYALTATCTRNGSELLSPATLRVALLPPADSIVEVDAPLILARLRAALDADGDGKITCREAAAAVEAVDLSGLDLSAAPQELFRVMPRVKALNLRDNKLTALPEDLRYMTSLEALDLSGNPLERMEADLPDTLKALDVHSCALDLEGTPEAERIDALKAKKVDVRCEGQIARCIYLPLNLDPITLAVGERYRDPGFRWQTIRGNPLRVTNQAPPDIETLLIAPDGSMSACRYDMLVFDAPGVYELSYTLGGSDVGSRKITVTGSALATAPPAQEAADADIQRVTVLADDPRADAGGGMSRTAIAALLGLGCVGLFLVTVAVGIRPRSLGPLRRGPRRRS